MASRPILAALSAKIDALGEDEIFERIANGEYMHEIAKDLGCTRGLLYLWIKNGGDERKAKFASAREMSAHALADDAGKILDDVVPTTNADVTHAVARSKYRQWLAEKRNRTEYGEPEKTPIINVNVQSLHLDALRQHGRVATARHEALPAGDVVDAEIVEVNDG